MNYSIRNDCLTIRYPAPKREKPKQVQLNLASCRIPDNQLRPFIEVACDRYSGQSFDSKLMIRVSLGSLILFLSNGQSQLPSYSHDWQEFVLSMLRWYLINPKSKKNLANRLNDWNCQIVPFLLLCQDRDLIPLDVQISKAKTKNERTKAKRCKLLGEVPPRKIKSAEKISKLLVNIDYTRSDAEYLDQIHNDSLRKVSLLKKICLRHWENVKHVHKMGERIALKTSKNELFRIMESDNYYSECPGKVRSREAHLMRAGAFGESAASLLLSQLFHLLDTTNSAGCTTTKYLANTPFAPKNLDRTTALLTEAGKYLRQYSTVIEDSIPASQVVFRFLGLLQNVDMAVLCCLLIIEHPRFNPNSLTNAKLLNSNGKSYVLMGENSELSIFSVNKPRANSRKFSVLTPLSKEIVKFIISSTSRVRRILKSNNDPNWRYLFLGITRTSRKLGPIVGETSTYLSNGKSKSCLTKLYPELIEEGLGAGTLTLKSLRATLGVLRWFETGSIIEASKTLGNSTKICLEHYIPPALLYAWNVRLVRRFQQTLITLACHNEKYLFEISDFNSFSDLTCFIEQLLYESKHRKDPISKEIKSRLSTNFVNSMSETSNIKNSDVESLLNINLSPLSLAALYCYEEVALDMPLHIQQSANPITSLTPKHFIDLSRMLRHIAEGENLSCNFSEQIDCSDLRLYHKKAMIEKSIIRESFKRLMLNNKWSQS